MSKAEDDLIEAIFAEHAAEPSRAPSSLVLPGDKVTVVLEAIDARRWRCTNARRKLKCSQIASGVWRCFPIFAALERC